jgi:hypothetical protein
VGRLTGSWSPPFPVCGFARKRQSHGVWCACSRSVEHQDLARVIGSCTTPDDWASPARSCDARPILRPASLCASGVSHRKLGRAQPRDRPAASSPYSALNSSSLAGVMLCRSRIAAADVSGATTSERRDLPRARRTLRTNLHLRHVFSALSRHRSSVGRAFELAGSIEAGWKPLAPSNALQPPSTALKKPVNTAYSRIRPSSTHRCPHLSRRRSPVRIRLGVLARWMARPLS